jgi:hypothetical protein
LQSSAKSQSPGLKGTRKLEDLTGFFGQPFPSLGSVSTQQPFSVFASGSNVPFTGVGVNTGPTTTITNNFNSGLFEGAGGSGGGAAFGEGSLSFSLENVGNFESSNSGATTSSGGASGFVGLDNAEGSNFLKSIFGPNAFGASNP